MKRVVLAGVLAGLAFFVWLSVVHLATPLGQVGIRAIPNEAVVVGAIQSSVSEEGFYMFPGAVPPAHATAAEKKAIMAAAMEKMKTSPTGIMVVFPSGKNPLSPRQLVTELLSDMTQGLLLAWLVCNSTMLKMGEKVRFALMVGLAAAIVTNISYWNWYGFPLSYTLAYMFGQVSGYMIMGFTIAVVTSKSQPVVREQPATA